MNASDLAGHKYPGNIQCLEEVHKLPGDFPVENDDNVLSPRYQSVEQFELIWDLVVILNVDLRVFLTASNLTQVILPPLWVETQFKSLFLRKLSSGLRISLLNRSPAEPRLEFAGINKEVLDFKEV